MNMLVVTVKIVVVPANHADGGLQRLPRFDLVEELEDQRPKDEIVSRPVLVVLHFPDEVLTDPVRGAVHIRETEPRDYSVGHVMFVGRTLKTLEKHLLPTLREPPVGLEYRRWRRLSAASEKLDLR